MADLKELQKIRQCGRLETTSTARHHTGHYNNVGLAATYSSLSSTPESMQVLVYATLRKVICKHPGLSAITLNEDKSYPHPYFARLPSVDLRTCVEFRERKGSIPGDGEADTEMDLLITEQHRLGYKTDVPSKPFWRLIVLTLPADQNTFTAAWFFHHTVGDGTSAFIFHETFLASLNALESNPVADPIVEAPTNTTFPKAFEKMHPMNTTLPFVAKTVCKHYLPLIFNKRPAKLWTGNDVPATVGPNPPFNYRTFVLSAHVTSRLVQICRRERATVTSTIECLVAASLFTYLPEDSVDQIRFSGPISMRRFLKDNVPADQFVNAVSTWDMKHYRKNHMPNTTVDAKQGSVLQRFSWDESRAIKAAIQKQVSKEGRDNKIAMLKYVPNIPDYWAGHQGKPREKTAEMSNIGVYKAKATPGEAKWQIGRIAFSQCAAPQGSAFGVNVVTGGDGNASINFGWLDAAIEKDLLTKIIEGVVNGLEELVATSDQEA
ncbi:alcohol acetyltransferase [Phaeosphaeriaceae sp. PMI808]|nr:alcohol acetyltransferase [Phaeosphaeriaceae sp. PMI808]